MTKMKVMRISWINLPLLVACALLLGAAWFVPRSSDPGGQGDIVLSMMLMVRALAMPQSKWVTLIGCVLAAIALAGNAGLLPGGGFRIATTVVIIALGVVFLFWERLVSRLDTTKTAIPPAKPTP
jgi:hypothetical protein